jgi:hypothetical protein
MGDPNIGEGADRNTESMFSGEFHAVGRDSSDILPLKLPVKMIRDMVMDFVPLTEQEESMNFFARKVYLTLDDIVRDNEPGKRDENMEHFILALQKQSFLPVIEKEKLIEFLLKNPSNEELVKLSDVFYSKYLERAQKIIDFNISKQ